MKMFVLFCLIVVAVANASESDERPPWVVCKPKSIFMIKCNQCACSDDGKEMICTKMACPPQSPLQPWGPRYTTGEPCPGKYFYSECNQCTCLKDGKSAACTMMLCDAFN